MPKTADELQADLDAALSELSTAKDRIKELNGEAQGRRNSLSAEKKRADDLQTQLDALTSERDTAAAKHAQDMERQRIDLTAKSADDTRRAEETIAAYKTKQTDLSLGNAARELGMVDMDGLKLLDRAALKIADDGSVENAADVLGAFKEAKPYFFGAAQKPGTVTGNTTSPAAPPRPNPPASFDARTASAADVAANARALGITVPLN